MPHTPLGLLLSGFISLLSTTVILSKNPNEFNVTKCNWHSMLCQLQVDSAVIRHLHNLWSDHPNESSTRLTPHVVITMLPTIFPRWCFAPRWLVYNYQFVLLNPITVFTHLPNPSLTWQPSKCSLYLWVCFGLPGCLFCFLGSTYKWNHVTFVFLYLTYYTQHNTL